MRRTYKRPVWWVVLSPEYADYSSDWSDPPEFGRDVLYAFSRTAQRAKVLAVRAWRRNWRKGCRTGRTLTRREPYIVRYNDENPMAALKVIREHLVERPAREAAQ